MELINFEDNLYMVYRRIKEANMRPGTGFVEFMKEFWRCDIALKKEQWVLFCRHIPDATIITDEELKKD